MMLNNRLRNRTMQ